MNSLCEKCPLRAICPNPAITTWAWFNMVVDRSTGLLPSSEHDARSLLRNAAAQAEITIDPGQYDAELLAMKGLITCFVEHQTGSCERTPQAI